MTKAWRGEIPTLVLLSGWFASVAVLWSRSPERLPTHMGFTGDIDAYGGKFEGLLFVPLVGLVLYVFMLLVPRWDKSFQTGQNRLGATPVFRLATILVLVLAQLLVVGRELSPQFGGSGLMSALVGAFFVVIGNSLGKTRPGKFYGVRTPWTFKSKLSWVGSNRMGGWLMVGEGLTLVFIAFLYPQIWYKFFFVATWFLVIGLFAYSYHLFRNDPNPVPPFRTATGSDGK